MRIVELLQGLRDFANDETGSASVEFVVNMPLLFAVMAMSFEYSRAYEIREALDSGVRDATRLLARAPAIAVDPDDITTERPAAHEFFIDEARAIVARRTGFEITASEMPDPIFSLNQGINPTGDGNAFRTAYWEVAVTVTIEANLPLLGLFSNFLSEAGQQRAQERTTLTMVASDSGRYLSAVPLSDTACSYVRNIHARVDPDDDLVECDE